MAVPGQAASHLGEQNLRFRPDQLVDIIDKQTNVDRRHVPDGRQHVGARAAARATGPTGRPTTSGGKAGRILVIRLAGHPAVDSERRSQITAHGLGQERCLPETGSGHDGGDHLIEAGIEHRDQAVRTTSARRAREDGTANNEELRTVASTCATISLEWASSRRTSVSTHPPHDLHMGHM